MIKLGILLSGRGSNFLAIARNISEGRLDASIAVVVSNKPDAAGLESARGMNLPAFAISSNGLAREEHERKVAEVLQQHGVDYIVLAGYMRLLSPWFVQQFPNRILNIHPSLLPAFPGVDAQKQAFDYGCKVAGCTVHFVDEHLDAGPIILQRTVPVLADDTAETLSARILEQEHIAYSEALKVIACGDFRIEGRRVVLAKAAQAPAQDYK